jgi:hypothetical protein
MLKPLLFAQGTAKSSFSGSRVAGPDMRLNRAEP